MNGETVISFGHKKVLFRSANPEKARELKKNSLNKPFNTKNSARNQDPIIQVLWRKDPAY